MTNREIDALVAEHVMGWDMQHEINREGVLEYSTRISDAWDVIDKMLAEKWTYELSKYARNHHCTLISWVLVGDGKQQIIVHAEDGTAPMAICLAALKAKGVDIS